MSPSFPPRPSRSLKGKVAIVTGAGSQGDALGNGRAISLLLAEDGARVVCADVDLAAAERTAALVRKDGGNHNGSQEALAVRADVSVEGDCKALVEATVAAFGRVDILVNNVGIFGAQGTALEADAESWEKGWAVNVTSMVLMAKHAVPAMLRNKPGDGGVRGSIVNLGSIVGLRGGTPHLFYPTSKGAVINLTKSMAAHHGAQGIRVNCVCPGFLYTPMVASTGMTEESREARKKQGLLQTEGNAWDCAAAVRFLAGGDARWITGTSITVDAGVTNSIPFPKL